MCYFGGDHFGEPRVLQRSKDGIGMGVGEIFSNTHNLRSLTETFNVKVKQTEETSEIQLASIGERAKKLFCWKHC